MGARILQIIPADGWVAKYTEGEEDIESPLLCFALCEEEGVTFVDGIDSDGRGIVGLCSESSNFNGFRLISRCSLNSLRESAELRHYISH